MRDKTLSLHSNFSVNGELSDNDTRFISVTIDVMHTGENLNGSFFEKSVVDSCIDSIKNTPVLGFVKYDNVAEEYDFGGHEYVTEFFEDGVVQKYIGSAYGVIPESCNPRWFTKMCDDGREREFLQVDALLWTKFDDSSDIVMRDSEKAQSMELSLSSIEGEEDENGIFRFKEFKFDGCCILGNDKTPAMTGANVKIKDVEFSMNGVDYAIRKELNDKFSTFSKLINEKSIQGGVGNMPNSYFAQTVMQQFSDISAMVSAQENFTDIWGYDSPRFYAADIQDSEVIVVDCKDNYHYYGVPFTMDGDRPVMDFACKKRKKVTYSDYEAGASALEGAFDFGEYISHIENEAFAKVEEEKKKKKAEEDKKASEEDKKKPEEDEGKTQNPKKSEDENKKPEDEKKSEKPEEDPEESKGNKPSEDDEDEKKKAEEKKKKLKDNEYAYEQLKKEYDEIKAKYDAYVEAEAKREAEKLDAQKDAKFSEYEDVLSNNAEFAALKERKGEMSVDDIEKECAVLYAKVNLPKSSFSASGSTVATVGVIFDGDGAMDGYAHTKYGNIRVSR